MNRRELIAATAAATHPVRATAGEPSEAEVQALLDRYIACGDKASGGAGDEQVGEWLGATLRRLGFAVERQRFEAPFFEVATAELSSGDLKASVRPQALVAPTSAEGVAGPLALLQSWSPPADLRGRIALVPLAYARWSSATSPAVREAVRAATSAGAIAVVLVTTGPSGEALALNADVVEPLSDGPVAILAPRDAAPFLKSAAEGARGRLVLTGRGGRRSAFNLVGRLDRGRGRWLVVSTPRSGWGVCAGERGGGVAVWALLAQWAARRLALDLTFLCNSGHEYENLGADHALQGAAPAVDRTDLWLHLGANVAARDWQETPKDLLPLPSADPQRFLLASPSLMAACETAFRGLPGLEAVHPAEAAGAAGELAPILAAGYPRVAGVFGAHRFHHAPSDDFRCVSAARTREVFVAFRTLLTAVPGGWPIQTAPKRRAP